MQISYLVMPKGQADRHQETAVREAFSRTGLCIHCHILFEAEGIFLDLRQTWQPMRKKANLAMCKCFKYD